MPRKKYNSKLVPVYMRMPSDLKDSIQKKCIKMNKSFSRFVNDCLQKEIDNDRTNRGD